jgi:dihydrodipicolinate synthase/N-acetylneuraminate lyase
MSNMPTRSDRTAPPSSNEPPFRGVGVPLITIRFDDGEVNYPATAALARHMVEVEHVDAIITGGTSGESFALSVRERETILEEVIKSVKGAVPVIAGVGTVKLEDSLELTRHAVQAGASAVLSGPAQDAGQQDRYGQLDEAGLMNHFTQTVEAAGSLPVIAYNLSEWYPEIPVASFPALLQITGVKEGDPGVVGVKDSDGDRDRLMDELKLAQKLKLADDGRFHVYTGSPHLLTVIAANGGAGTIAGMAGAYVDLIKAALAGDEKAQADVSRAEKPLGDPEVYGGLLFPENLKEMIKAELDLRFPDGPSLVPSVKTAKMPSPMADFLARRSAEQDVALEGSKGTGLV